MPAWKSGRIRNLINDADSDPPTCKLDTFTYIYVLDGIFSNLKLNHAMDIPDTRPRHAARDGEVEVLPGVGAAEVADPGVGPCAPGHLHTVPVTRHLRGGSSVHSKILEIQPGEVQYIQ